jgi:two-component system chemotaxis sensor kinase CheA
MSLDLADPADVFRMEAAEVLDQLETTLLDLDRNTEDRALVDAAFRAMHTIKGSGSMFGFTDVAGFMHEFETTFDLVRKGSIPASRGLIAVALEAKDHVRTLIEMPELADAAQGERILSALRDAAGSKDAGTTGSAAEPTPVLPTEPVQTRWRIRFRFTADVLGNGTNPLRLIEELRDLGPCDVAADTAAIPALEELEPETCYVAWDIRLTAPVARDDIDSVFIFVADDLDLTIEPLAGADTAGAPAAPSPEAAVPAPIPAAPAGLADARSPQPLAPKPPAKAPDDEQAGGRTARASETIRVQAERLDELMDRVGELVISQARLLQLADSASESGLKSVAEDIGRLTAGLRDTAMGIRLVPIGSLFGRFRRLVHDLSRELGKPVELITEGEETELDKTVVERLADPLIHLIRNSLDHGLEKPEARTASGKPAQGRLKLLARHRGAEVHITISDDGAGLDKARIRAKAEESGIVRPDDQLTDAEVYNLIFEPGFSTAREVSSLSGRGVGMDVVKRTIEGLRGSIDLATEPGHGTDLTLRLPLTLAIIDGLLVELAGARYVIPLAAVQECVELTAEDETRLAGRNLLDIRGELVPFMRLRELFDEPTVTDPYQKVVIVAAGDMRVGLVVDRIIGSHQTVIKSLSKLHAGVKTFSGATILPDGAAALIFDIPQLVERGQDHARRFALTSLEAA